MGKATRKRKLKELYVYVTLKEAENCAQENIDSYPNPTCNIYAIITKVQNFGDDFTLTLMDETTTDFQIKVLNGSKLLFEAGDLVRVHRLMLSVKESTIGFCHQVTSILLFKELTAYQPISVAKTYTFDANTDGARITELRDLQVRVGIIPNCLSDLTMGPVKNLLVQVIGFRISKDGKVGFLFVWDGTKTPFDLKYYSIYNEDHHHLIKMDEELKGRSIHCRITVFIFDNLTKQIADLTPGQFINLTTAKVCRLQNSEEKYLKLLSNVQVMDESNPRVIALKERLSKVPKATRDAISPTIDSHKYNKEENVDVIGPETSGPSSPKKKSPQKDLCQVELSRNVQVNKEQPVGQTTANEDDGQKKVSSPVDSSAQTKETFIVLNCREGASYSKSQNIVITLPETLSSGHVVVVEKACTSCQVHNDDSSTFNNNNDCPAQCEQHQTMNIQISPNLATNLSRAPISLTITLPENHCYKNNRVEHISECQRKNLQKENSSSMESMTSSYVSTLAMANSLSSRTTPSPPVLWSAITPTSNYTDSPNSVRTNSSNSVGANSHNSVGANSPNSVGPNSPNSVGTNSPNSVQTNSSNSVGTNSPTSLRAISANLSPSMSPFEINSHLPSSFESENPTSSSSDSRNQQGINQSSSMSQSVIRQGENSHQSNPFRILKVIEVLINSENSKDDLVSLYCSTCQQIFEIPPSILRNELTNRYNPIIFCSLCRKNRKGRNCLKFIWNINLLVETENGSKIRTHIIEEEGLSLMKNTLPEEYYLSNKNMMRVACRLLNMDKEVFEKLPIFAKSYIWKPPEENNFIIKCHLIKRKYGVTTVLKMCNITYF